MMLAESLDLAEMLVVEELYREVAVNTDRQMIIFNGELDRIRSGFERRATCEHCFPLCNMYAINCGINSTKGPVIGGPFNLLDIEGRSVTEQNLLGNWVLLYFGYTSSPDVRPSEVEKMAKAVDILESKRNLKVLPVFATIDPQRDNPPQLQAYLKGFSWIWSGGCCIKDICICFS